ncbi:hypothetical protein HanRHA438_Chr03g0111991 [Helianthus annuus]|nr:hypothetical protein HanRHA438_Chr03g0111991 [Helianthus annuus]
MYNSFKHQKTSISTYTLQPKNTDTSQGFTLISKHFKMPASCSSLSLSLSLSLFGDFRSGSRVFLHHVSTTPIRHVNHWNQTQV